MENICFEILNDWAKYIDYDENQKQFNLLNWSYETHKATKNLKHIIDDYDDTGLIAVLTVKRLFSKMLKDSRMSLFDILNNPDELEKHKKMFDTFNNKGILQAEKKYFDTIQSLVCKVIGKDLLGEIDSENFENKVFDYTDIVISTLDKCKIEFYQKGSNLKEITNFSTNIHVFPSLAECLLTLNNVKDGMYLCFIDINHTADSYFGFFIKNNGNLFSVNERISESFKGQHTNSRNGRWAEGKADDIFPYDFIFSYDNYDYKGYSHTYTIDENKLALFEMEEDAYLPLLIAMVMLVRKLRNINIDDYSVVFIDSLLKVNLPRLNTNKNELMLLEKNELVQRNNTITLDFDYDDIMSGKALEEFTVTDEERKQGKYNLVSAANRGQLFVDLYGDGFEIQSNILSTQKLLTSGNYEYVPEFIGSEHLFRGQAYCEIRQQLADYIRQKMFEEYKGFGGMSAVNSWFETAIATHLEQLKKATVNYYVDVKEGKEKNILGGWQPSSCDNHYYISLLENEKYVSYEYGRVYYVNSRDNRAEKIYDMDTGSVCSMFFVFRPINYLGLEYLFGTIPKIVKGWSKDGNRTSGNSLLSMTDAVESVNTPFEYYCSNRPEYKDEHTYTNFSFVIGYSKRGFSALCKKYGVDIAKYRKQEK